VRAVILARSILRSDLPQNMSSRRYVLVNIPEFRLRVLDKKQEIFSSRVIVGQIKRQTPILSSEISSIVVNPAWHVPASILQKDLVPKLAKDKHFLDKGQFELVDSQGITVDPAAMVWDGTEENFPYQLRQKPGDHNALGRYKFYLPNNDAIYLHSTSSPGYFKRDLRALSSGCVRVEEADDFARLLLKDSKWNINKLDQMLKEDTTKWLSMTDPVPVYTVYWRSWVDKQGQLQFRDDIYQFEDDARMANTAVINSLVGHS
jgi:murein L,D-transpeptidase YcbB/YkuD